MVSKLVKVQKHYVKAAYSAKHTYTLMVYLKSGGFFHRFFYVLVGMVENRQITTLEGLAQKGQPNDVQQAFIDCQAAQCGYCLNGMVMTVQALLDRNPQATEEQIRDELRYNLCRCGTHVEIMQAALRVAKARQ